MMDRTANNCSSSCWRFFQRKQTKFPPSNCFKENTAADKRLWEATPPPPPNTHTLTLTAWVQGYHWQQKYHRTSRQRKSRREVPPLGTGSQTSCGCCGWTGVSLLSLSCRTVKRPLQQSNDRLSTSSMTITTSTLLAWLTLAPDNPPV